MSYRRAFYPTIETIPGLEIITDISDISYDEFLQIINILYELNRPEEITPTSIKNNLLTSLNKKANLYNDDEEELRKAPVGGLAQAINILNTMEQDTDNLAPLEDIIDNDEALKVVFKDTEYDNSKNPSDT